MLPRQFLYELNTTEASSSCLNLPNHHFCTLACPTTFFPPSAVETTEFTLSQFKLNFALDIFSQRSQQQEDLSNRTHLEIEENSVSCTLPKIITTTKAEVMTIHLGFALDTRSDRNPYKDKNHDHRYSHGAGSRPRSGRDYRNDRGHRSRDDRQNKEDDSLNRRITSLTLLP